MQVLAEVPWAGRIWGLPFLTVLAPSERYNRGARPSAQDAARVGAADDPATAPLAARSRAGRGRGQHLRRPGAAGRRGPAAAPGDGGHPPAPGRRPVRPGATARAGTKGRPRVKGERQPTLAQRLLDPDTAWETLTVPWYGGGTAQVEAATGTALWYHPGDPTVALRWVLLRDPAGAVRAASPAQYRPDRRPGPDRRLVRRPLAARSHLPGGPRSSRRRDPAPMVRPRHPPHHPGPARALLAGHPLRPGSPRRPAPARSGRPPGMPSPPRPSPTPSPSSASSSGPSPFSRPHRRPTRSSKSPAPSSTA